MCIRFCVFCAGWIESFPRSFGSDIRVGMEVGEERERGGKTSFLFGGDRMRKTRVDIFLGARRRWGRR